MSTVTADATAAEAAPVARAPRNWKKLVVMAVIGVLVLAIAGGGALFFLKKRAAANEAVEGEEGAEAAEQVEEQAKHDPKAVPTFSPLEPFTVNLADREAERYAQVGLTLELDDPKSADHIKNFMPAIRNNILMVLSHKTSQELLAREGKEKLAREVRREATRAMGLPVPAEEAPAAAAGAASGAASAPKAKKAKDFASPIRHVHFSNFIIQ